MGDVLHTDDPSKPGNYSAEEYWAKMDEINEFNKAHGVERCGVPEAAVEQVLADLDGDGVPG